MLQKALVDLASLTQRPARAACLVFYLDLRASTHAVSRRARSVGSAVMVRLLLMAPVIGIPMTPGAVSSADILPHCKGHGR